MKFTLALFLAFSFTALTAQTNWTLDKGHSDIRFTVTHMTISKLDGQFDDFEGKVTSTTPDFNGSTVEFTAKTASVDTDNERRDQHLKSDDFFNAEKYPELKFKGKLNKKGKKYQLVGDFTLRDVTKPVTFNVQYLGAVETKRGKKAGFVLTGTINRFDYGVKWDSKLDNGNGLVVANEVMITCQIELNEVKAEAPKQ
ncbi:MAG: YceI family protein [Saprospiraceae bacterium]